MSGRILCGGGRVIRQRSLLFTHINIVAIGFEEGVLFDEVKIVGYHFGNHLVEGYFWNST